MQKSVTRAMELEDIRVLRSRPVRTKLSKRIETKALDKFSSGRIIWYLLKKHEVGILQVLVGVEFIIGILRLL